jgi:hypothetical protein
VAHSTERVRELRRRRKRTKKYKLAVRKAGKATISEKAHLAGKLRKMSTGGELVVARLGLVERK